MSAVDTALLAEMRKRIDEETKAKTEQLLSVTAIDFADYRYRVGYIRGLTKALDIAQSALDEISGG